MYWQWGDGGMKSIRMEGQGRTGCTNQNDQQQGGEDVSRKIHMARGKLCTTRRNNFSENMTETLKQS